MSTLCQLCARASVPLPHVLGYINLAHLFMNAPEGGQQGTHGQRTPNTHTQTLHCPRASRPSESCVFTMSADQTVATGLALLAAQPPLEPGQLLENVRLTVRGILRARRDHSASISFLELSDGSTDEAGQMLQVCINRAKCDDTPGTRHALEQLNIGDTLCCAGPPGRTRTGRAELTLFARSVELVRYATKGSNPGLAGRTHTRESCVGQRDP